MGVMVRLHQRSTEVYYIHATIDSRVIESLTAYVLRAERSSSAQALVLATVQEDIGYPLGITVPKWMGFQIGGLH